MPDKKSLVDMSDQELQELDVKLTAQKMELRQTRLAVAHERNARHSLAMAKARLKKLNPGEKAALIQVVQAEGAASEEAVGTPGT